MTSIRPFAIACGIGFVSMLGAAIIGSAIYQGETEVRWTPIRIGLASLVLTGFLVFVYTLVPLLLRGFLQAQVRIGNTELPVVRWLLSHERTAWFAVWTIWTLGLALGLPFAIHDWSQNSKAPAQEQRP
ncbi:MAG TPA: hypothetical protein VFU03_08055 [Gemmatimonadales bacterium]|nr:hypothetical protein [Gemmatimonadales bacterium]